MNRGRICCGVTGMVMIVFASGLARGETSKVNRGRQLTAAEKGPGIVETWSEAKAREEQFGTPRIAPIKISPLYRPAIPLQQTNSGPNLSMVPVESTLPALGASTRSVPQLDLNFVGLKLGDFGANFIPPDTMGAIGPNHYVEAINGAFGIYNRTTGALISGIDWDVFWSGVPHSGLSDPRIVFDQHSGRWVTTAIDLSSPANRIMLAVSATDDPTGSWFKTSFFALSFADYETLGVDENGIYVAAGFANEVWAIDKAPLIAPVQSLGTVTSFSQSVIGAMQPCHTYGTPGAEYLIQTSSFGSPSTLSVFRIDPPLTAPSLAATGSANVGTYSHPPNAPAPGATVDVDTIDHRLMMSIYRDGAIWTTHAVDVNGRAAVRWYQINAATRIVIQQGEIDDPSLYYYDPSINVNLVGDAIIGFSGSDANTFITAYYTGRFGIDPLGNMDPVQVLKAGEATYNLQGGGRLRWGDYSYTTLDPLDELTLWTIQEYAKSPGNVWGTWIGSFTADCNTNGIPDGQDVSGGTSLDCNSNGAPDECELQNDDCNNNLVPDDCDIAGATSNDCNSNAIPDECEGDCNTNTFPDDCDIAFGTSIDCDSNGIPDECPGGVVGSDVLASSNVNNNVLQYDGVTGAFVSELVAAGSLSGTRGMTFRPNGNLLVCSGNDDRVVEFTSNGTLVGDFVTAGLGGLNLPIDAVYGPSGNLFVAGTLSDNVIEYHGTTGALVGVFTSGGGLDAPTDLTFGPAGDLYVCSNSANKVLSFNGTTGAFISDFVSAGSGGLTFPQGLVFGPDGDLYVTSSGNDTVLRYNGSTGAFLGTFVASGAGGLDNPADLLFASDSLNLLVASNNTGELLEYDGGSGAFIKSFSGGGLSSPWGIALTAPQPCVPGGTSWFINSNGIFSRKTHGGGVGVFDLPLSLTTCTTESRTTGGPDTVVVQFTEDMNVGSITANGTVTITRVDAAPGAETITSVSAGATPNEVILGVGGLTNVAVYEIAFDTANVLTASGLPADAGADSDFEVGVLNGDSTGDGLTAAADKNNVTGNWNAVPGTDALKRADFNLDGVLSAADKNAVTGNWNSATNSLVPSCP